MEAEDGLKVGDRNPFHERNKLRSAYDRSAGAAGMGYRVVGSRKMQWNVSSRSTELMMLSGSAVDQRSII